MSLCESMQRFINEQELIKANCDTKSREFVILSCKIMYARNLLQVLLAPPVPAEDIHHVREEFKKLVLKKDFVGAGHQQLLDDFDKTGNGILF